MKYIIIEFKGSRFCINKTINTKYFFPNKENKYDDDIDYEAVLGTNNKAQKRTEEHSIKLSDNPLCLITKHQVSGLLHKLFGYIPVSYYKSQPLSRINLIDKISNQAYIKFDNVTNYSTKNGNVKYYAESEQGAKSQYNSRSKFAVTKASDGVTYKGSISWDMLRRRFVYNKYKQIMEFLHQICKDESLFDKLSLIDFLHEVTKDDSVKQQAINFFTSIGGCKPLARVINHDGNTGDFNCEGSFATILNSKCLKCTITINGKIAVPLTKEDYKELTIADPTTSLVHRMATFGDRGYAEIIDILDADEDELVYGMDYTDINENTEV